MEMAVVCGQRRLALQRPTRGGCEQFENGNGDQPQNANGTDACTIGLHQPERERGQHEPQQRAAGVAHEGAHAAVE